MKRSKNHSDSCDAKRLHPFRVVTWQWQRIVRTVMASSEEGAEQRVLEGELEAEFIQEHGEHVLDVELIE